MNPFATGLMSAGYAASRPPVHRRVVKLLAERQALGGVVLDLGCGSGLSTKALEGIASRRIGIEPVEAMVGRAHGVAAGAAFAVGRAEALPLRGASIDWISAAGALNYVDLPAFFAEAKRVLRPKGGLAVYDFSPGRSMLSSPLLDSWFDNFIDRYPWAPSEAHTLDPEILSQLNPGFVMDSADTFTVDLALARDFYADYMMTESNVAYALRRGTPLAEIKSWIQSTLPPDGWSNVLFRGYWAILRSAN